MKDSFLVFCVKFFGHTLKTRLVILPIIGLVGWPIVALYLQLNLLLTLCVASWLLSLIFFVSTFLTWREEKARVDSAQEPFIAWTGSGFTRQPNKSWLSVGIKNFSDDAYVLEAISINGFSAQPGVSLEVGKYTHVNIYGEVLPFDIGSPQLEMIIARGKRRYRILQVARTKQDQNGKWVLANGYNNPIIERC